MTSAANMIDVCPTLRGFDEAENRGVFLTDEIADGEGDD